MALSKFEKDMAVIQKLDDEPNDVGGLTAAELKAKFDEGGEAVKKYLNDTLTPELEHGFSEKVPSSTTINGHPLTENVTITKDDVELGDVDNTSDLDKPISTAQQKALDTLDKEKADAANVLTKDNHTPYTPTEPDHPATKGYVDETTAGVVMGQLPDGAVTPDKLDRAYLPLSGGTLTGPVTLHGDPQSPLQAAPKRYVDASRAITRRLPVAPGYSVKAGDVVDVGKEPIKGPISSKAEGSIIQLNEGGKPVDFYVAKHDYENGLNGAGRTLVVRKESYDLRQWHSSNVNAYASSTIDAWLNGTYKNLLDADIRGVIGTTKFYYTPGNGNTSVSTLSRAIFLLSITELGQSHSYANTEGSALPIASTLKIANYNGSPNTQWTRSPYTGSTDFAWGLDSDGSIGGSSCTNTYGARPVFTLPATFPIKVGNGDEVVVKDIEPQANVERVFNSNTGTTGVDLIRLSDKYCIAADIDSSGSTVKCFLLNAETGEKNYEGVVAPGGPTFKMVSLARLNDSRFVVGYLESGCLRAKVGTVNVTNFSFGTQRTAINSNLTGGILIALSETKVLAIANRNGIDARVCTISGTEIDDDTGANHATVPGVTSVSRLSATLLPDDERGNKRVCVCFADVADGSKGKAVIATIDSTNQVTWGEVVTWMDTLRPVESLSCCFDGDYVIVAAGNWVTVRAISIEPKLSVAGKPVNASHTSVSPQSALVHANGKSILLYNDRPSGGRKEGTRACIIHNQSGDLSFGPEFIFANNSIRGLSAGWASDGHVLAAYADGGNSNRGTCTILTVDGDQIAGSFLDKSSQAIALQDGNAGDLIDIIYSGTADLPVAQGTKIESLGVQGYAPMEGLLEVFPWYLPGVKIATGSYTGNGVYGSGNPNTLTFPFEPKMLMVLPDPTIASTSYCGFWCLGNPGITGQIPANASGSTVSVSGNTISWFSTGNAQMQLNVDNQKYYYIALG